MLMIAEIMLTVAAWKKGWKGYALLPGAIGFAVAFLIGATMGPALKQFAPALLLIDLGIIGTLIFMTRKAPHAQPSIIADARTDRPIRLREEVEYGAQSGIR